MTDKTKEKPEAQKPEKEGEITTRGAGGNGKQRQ